jgi:hypothetical protein
VILLATSGVSCAARPTVKWVPDPASPGQAIAEVRNLDSGYGMSRSFTVYARPASGGPEVSDLRRTTPAMLGGHLEKKGHVLRYRPAFPMERGVRYTAVVEIRFLNGKVTNLSATYVVPARPEAPPTVVAHVYPSAAELPENLLKFYVHFSAPMSRGDVYRHVRLIDDKGAEVELPFLELGEELWDPAMTRLTLYIDPGRIKRGVRPLEEIGPALLEGRRYTLVIDRGMVDATGRELAQEFHKPFTVGPPDRDPPDPAKWKITAPHGASRAPVTIHFADPMDHALAERLIRVTTGDRVVPGAVSLGDDERRWTFTPDAPWRAGRYEVVVQPTIEDLAGNNVGKPFEVDMQSGGEPDLKPARIPFEVR